LIRTYSGGVWSGDWVEHFDRTEFFLRHDNFRHLFIGLYLLPARPPMMNLVAAFFLAQVGNGFPAFELCFAILNLTAFLPAVLLLNRLSPRGGRGFWFLVAALASSPFFAQNVSYTWTKLLCAFYVLLAIALYLRNRPILAFVMLAAGCLVHYSAGPFALYLAGHYLWTMIRTRWKWREFAAILSLCAALLASWFAWSIQRYGLQTTLSSNTTVRDASKFTPAQNLTKIVDNIYDSIVPPLGRMDPRWRDQSVIGYVRDISFIWYQQNVLLMMGSVGAVIAMGILWRTGIKPRVEATKHANKRWFWIGLLAFCIPVSIATVGQYEPLGLAHAVLQPVALIGVTAVAAYARRLPRWVFRLLLLGWGVDFSLGIVMQVYLENLLLKVITGAGGSKFWLTPIRLAPIAAANANAKQVFHLRLIGDYCGNASTALLAALVAGELAGLWWLLRTRPPRSSGFGQRQPPRR
jgi:hypothetical protein